jgi:hypothetical protein
VNRANGEHVTKQADASGAPHNEDATEQDGYFCFHGVALIRFLALKQEPPRNEGDEDCASDSNPVRDPNTANMGIRFSNHFLPRIKNHQTAIEAGFGLTFPLLARARLKRNRHFQKKRLGQRTPKRCARRLRLNIMPPPESRSKGPSFSGHHYRHSVTLDSRAAGVAERR